MSFTITDLLVNNFLDGLLQEDEVMKLASNQIVSRILDDVLQYGKVPHVLSLSQILCQEIRAVCLDPFASHVLQTLMVLSLKFTQVRYVKTFFLMTYRKS